MNNTLLHRYFSGETSEEEERLISAWLDESAGNRAAFQKEREYYNLFLLISKGEQLIVPSSKRLIPGWLKEVAKVAAVVLLMLGIGLYYRSARYAELSAAVHTISVPPGQRVNVVLPDGTYICVNACSKLEYPSAFVDDCRRIKLTGEAYFEVAYDKEKPFIVETQSYDIEVLGTAFNVESYPESHVYSTSLLKGRVKVTDKENPLRQVLLEPNQQVRLADNDLVVTPIADYDVLRWREGLICFKNKPFGQLMEQFEKYYDVRILIEKEELLIRELSGKIRINDGVESALKVIQKNTAFSYDFDSQSENVIYIR